MSALGSVGTPLCLDDLQKLPLYPKVVRETLELHPPVNGIMRKVKRRIPIGGTDMYVSESC